MPCIHHAFTIHSSFIPPIDDESFVHRSVIHPLSSFIPRLIPRILHLLLIPHSRTVPLPFIHLSITQSLTDHTSFISSSALNPGLIFTFNNTPPRCVPACGCSGISKSFLRRHALLKFYQHSLINPHLFNVHSSFLKPSSTTLPSIHLGQHCPGESQASLFHHSSLSSNNNFSCILILPTHHLPWHLFIIRSFNIHLFLMPTFITN